MLTKIEFKPGINKDNTPLASEGGWVDSDRVRFRQGKPEALGGWQARYPAGFTGIARGAHEWVDLASQPYLAWGTATKLYVLNGGALLDITPPLAEGVLTNPFSTTNGSAVVTVNHPAHGLQSANTITFTNASPVGGLTLAGSYPATVLNPSQYTVTASSNATATATSGTTATVDYRADLPVGNVDGVVSGYGVGGYGLGPYGGAASVDAEPRIWSLDNFGENLLAVPRGYGLYEWQPAFQSPDLVSNGGFSTDSAWTKGTGWTISGGVANKAAGTASQLSQPFASTFVGGKVYRVTFNVTVSAGSLKLQASSGVTPVVADVGGASTAITRSGSYSRTFRAPPTPSALVFAADAAFAGTLDAVTIKVEAAAYRVENAPTRIGTMFVDPNRFVVTLATQEADGDYNALLVRWCDQENDTLWFPDTTNLAGELPLASGGRLMSGLASRQQNLLWTDTSLFSLTFTGDSSVFSQRLLGTGCGLIGRNAATEFNGLTFWMSRNGFYVFQGSTPQKLPCPMERDVFDNLPVLQIEKIYAGINARFSEVWWSYPDSRDGIECSRIVVYNFAEQHWVTHTMDRTAWLPGDVFTDPIGFSASGQIYDHEVGQDANGAPLNCWLTSSAFDIEDGDNLVIVKQIIPDTEGQVGAITYDLTPKLFPAAANLPTTSHTAQVSTDALRMRRKGRQMSLGLRSVAAPAFFRLGALRLDVEKAGAKR